MPPIRDLFASNITRDIPPVVYFHEQSPEKLQSEVSEYIVTGGWPDDHPNHRRVPKGIHEEYVRLLKNIAAELAKPGGPALPNAWVSGFYGSGKSSFAKLLGLALDGVVLPSGQPLAEAWLSRDTSPRASELREAWQALRDKIEPISVVFDIGGTARDNEHIHATTVRQVQRRLGYCTTEPLVADFELKLERDGEWAQFEAKAAEVLGKPWAEVKDRSLAEEDFSVVMAAMYPERYADPMAWFLSRGGTHSRSESPAEAVAAIRDMLKYRKPNATLFLVVDEVSQYVLSNKDRVDRLRAFATELGATLKGRVWLLALGQQKLDEEADDSFLVWAKDRFPASLRVHLAATNIRDVVHKRLLQKKPEAEATLRTLFEAHRHDLKLYAYGCENVSPEEFIEVYPMLPGHIDLLLQITSALRTRSTRAQGDDQAIRGLLQLLGELFRDQRLADGEVGELVTLDRIYEVQHTALDSDVQASMARILAHCADDAQGLMVRAAKTVALLELIQDTMPTDAKLVAQCLYDRIDRGNHQAAVTEALEELRRRNLLGYSEKHGYKLQSSSGEEWERERRDMGAPREAVVEVLQETLKFLVAVPDRPKLQGRPFPIEAFFSDGRRVQDAILTNPADDATVKLDFRFLTFEERAEANWIKRSAEAALSDRLVWVAGDGANAEDVIKELVRSRAMVKRYKQRRESLNAARKSLLQNEENRAEDLEALAREAIAASWMAGKLYFRGRTMLPHDHGQAFAVTLHAAATRILQDLFPHYVATQVLPGELMQLVAAELSGPSPKFLTSDLGIIDLDSGRYMPTCSGVVPTRVQDYIEAEDGLTGTSLLAHFGGAPYGYTANVVKACVAGLLRASKVRLIPESGAEITAVRDAGVNDLFNQDRAFRRATIFPAGEDGVGLQTRNRICRFFEDQLQRPLDREDHLIADAVLELFPAQAQRLRDVLERLNRLPDPLETPTELSKLGEALEACVRISRQTKPTVMLVKKHLDTLSDGIKLLNFYDAELTADAIKRVREAASVRDRQAAQLREQGLLTPEAEAAAQRVEEHLSNVKPWREVTLLEADLSLLREQYMAAREQLLESQQRLVEQARDRVKGRTDYATLKPEEANTVMRPLAGVVKDTTSDAVAPSLRELISPFAAALQDAEGAANDRLDEYGKKLVVTIDLSLRNREIETEEQVNALIDEIKKRLLEKVQTGVRIRLL